jgi:hypothetical protein
MSWENVLGYVRSFHPYTITFTTRGTGFSFMMAAILHIITHRDIRLDNIILNIKKYKN